MTEQVHINDKFIKSFSIEDYEVLAEEGFVPVTHVYQTIPFIKYNVETSNNKQLACADEHILIDERGEEVFVRDLCVGHSIVKTKDGPAKITKLEKTDELENMYDISVDTENHTFYTNDILSHNSTIMTIYALWNTCFQDDKRVLIVANKEATAKLILRRIRTAYEQLPNWLKPGVKQWGKTEVVFSNDSSIIISSTSSSGARGDSINCVAGDSKILVRDKVTNEIRHMTMEELANTMKGCEEEMITTLVQKIRE